MALLAKRLSVKRFRMKPSSVTATFATSEALLRDHVNVVADAGFLALLLRHA